MVPYTHTYWTKKFRQFLNNLLYSLLLKQKNLSSFYKVLTTLLIKSNIYNSILSISLHSCILDQKISTVFYNIFTILVIQPKVIIAFKKFFQPYLSNQRTLTVFYQLLTSLFIRSKNSQQLFINILQPYLSN